VRDERGRERNAKRSGPPTGSSAKVQGPEATHAQSRGSPTENALAWDHRGGRGG